MYAKQFDRVISRLVQDNRKIIPTVSTASYPQSLWEASYAIELGKLMRLAEKLGVLDALVESKTYKLTAGYAIMAMTSDEFISALKYFAVLSYYLEHGKAPAIPLQTILQWQQNAVAVFAQFKINIRPAVSKITTAIMKPNVVLLNKNGDPTPAYAVLYDQTKVIRDAIWPKRNKILADPAATANLRTFLGKVLSYFNRKSEKGFPPLAQNTSALKDPKLSSIMHVQNTELLSNDAIVAYQRWIARRTARKGPLYLTNEEIEGLSDKDKETHKQLRAAHTKAYKAKLQDIIRTSEQPHLPANQVRKELHEAGFPHWPIPKGFTGNVGEKGELYTHTGKLLDKGQSGGVMEMNPDWAKNQSSFYARGRSNFATTPAWQYFNTQEHVKNARNDKKQLHANELEEKLPELQKKWRADLRSKDESDQLLGGMMEALYQTQARAGGESEQAYGLSTWLNKHIKTNAAGSLVITYPAKSGMTQKHVIRNDTPEKRALIALMLKLKNGKGPNDPIWSTQSGLAADANTVRRYLKYLGFEGKIHSFRHAAGNRAWDEAIANNPLKKKNPTAKEVADYHKAITLKVGQILGHQRTLKDGSVENVGSTAAKSYVDPQRQVKLFRDKGVPIPPALEKIAKDE